MLFNKNLTHYSSITLSVGEITHYIADLFQSEPMLQDVWIFGEVSNLAKPNSGHIYFTLKDQFAALKCVVWKSKVSRDTSLLENGMLIEAHGAIEIYETGGVYQLYIDKVRLQGSGYLFLEFIKLKQKLEKEGIFDSSHKRKLPIYPKKLGVITSISGAAIKDVLTTLNKRFPFTEVFVYATAVQGTDAVNEIVYALRYINQTVKPDAILLVRGGGSLEDLYPFNTEEVTKAIYHSPSPVVTGVGHETDFTLADFAADARAPTPTGAAILVTPDISQLFEKCLHIDQQIVRAVYSHIVKEKESAFLLKNILYRSTPINRIYQQWQSLDYIRQKINTKINYLLSFHRINIHQMKEKLALINPNNLLDRGYSIVCKEDGKIVRSCGQVIQKENLLIRLSRGSIGVEVKEIHDY